MQIVPASQTYQQTSSAKPSHKQFEVERKGGGLLTRIPIPIEIILRIAMTFQLQPRLLAGGAVREGDVVVGDIVEEMDLILRQHDGGGDAVHGCVAPAFVEEAAVVVQVVEVIGVGFAAQPIEVADLEIRPEVAVVVGFAAVRGDPGHAVVVGDVLRELLHEPFHAVP